MYLKADHRKTYGLCVLFVNCNVQSLQGPFHDRKNKITICTTDIKKKTTESKPSLPQNVSEVTMSPTSCRGLIMYICLH